MGREKTAKAGGSKKINKSDAFIWRKPWNKLVEQIIGKRIERRGQGRPFKNK